MSTATHQAPVQWPDFSARRRAVVGGAVLPAGTAQALVHEDRGSDSTPGFNLPVLTASAFVPGFDQLDFKALAEIEGFSRL